jgi:plasmid maintenance system antidote protein VapI
MNFQQLHELLRLELIRRIEHGALTGTRLAQLTGFRQGHISNFLNRKRALSLEGLDRMLAAQDLKIETFLPVEIAGSAADTPSTDAHSQTIPESRPQLSDPIEAIPVVTPSVAADEPNIEAALVVESIHVSAARLSENRARASRRAASWQRFIAVRADPHQAAAMHTVLAPGAVAIIDRHYNSLVPYRVDQPTIYAVRYGSGLLFRFVEFDNGHLILRPSSVDYPVQLLAVGPEQTPSDFIVGRVCLLIQEL